MTERHEGTSPHDGLFRGVVGVPVNAASVLASVLPAGVSDRLDLGSLRASPASFVDPDLRWCHSDLLFTADVDGRNGYVYVVIEHQSSADALMPLRMLEYTTRIWRQHLSGLEGPPRLPPVLPVVIYHHASRRWSAPTSLDGLYDVDAEIGQALERFLPRYEFLLQDLTQVDAAALRGAPLTPEARVTLAMLTFAPGNTNLVRVLARFAADLQVLVRRDRVDGTFGRIIDYVGRVSETPPAALRQFFRQLGPDAQEAYMATTLEQGIALGRAEGQAATLARLLTQKFGPLTTEQTARIQGASIDQLETWTDRILTADTIEAVLR
ncbi:Rpn family recombination-promoting nuclease/putative transposase [Ruania alkalisoli]|uniref:Rpn family recombination-promoting nuclease/putative transposase n=1 Tax=Ruania alkalisoli TaxID=2779775 RepID=A0A7M1SQ85_9MICO|nr:Rpn family recombination-promoting nuclease/putative transposase [Ruania alkalisoli]QOR69716.1 Rpn family recombination-promoting nuclease/putative transposase [Ruania alkalisoli]